MGSATAGLRLATRIARREAMRYKGRSALSIALLGIPLLGVAIGASAYDTIELSEEETAEQYLGENEAFIEAAYPGTPLTQYTWNDQYPWYEAEERVEEEGTSQASLTDMEVLAALPVGSWIAPYNVTGGGEDAQVETPDGVGRIGLLGYDLADRTYEAAGLEYLEGSAPVRDEVVLTAAAAEYLEVGVGDSIALVGSVSNEEHEVSGIIEVPWDLHGRYAIAPFFPDTSNGWLVDTPEELTYEDALKLNEIGMSVWATSLLDQPATTPGGGSYDDFSADDYMLTIYALIVVVVVMEVILLAGPAFAISTRRRTREFALMSANGATPAQIRNTVLAGGALFGVIAALAAVALGIAAVAVGMPWLEQLYGHRSAGLRVLPWLQAALVGVAIVTGLLSALAAAVSASRVNVVAALMGRTPGRKGSKRWVVIGLVMIGAGLASGFAGITIWNIQLMSAAIVLLQLGLVACTPGILALTARLGRWLPLAPRMALREAGRNRGSAAPAIAAVLGVVAGGMAFSMVFAADNVRMEGGREHLLPQGALTLNLYNQGGYDPETGEPVGTVDWDGAADEAEAKLRQRLADLQLTEIPFYDTESACGRTEEFPEDDVYCDLSLTRPEANRCPYWETVEEVWGAMDEGGMTGEAMPEEQIREAVAEAREDPRCDETVTTEGYGVYRVPTSTDPDVVAAYTELEGAELDAAVALLEGGGVIVADRWALTDAGTVVFEQTVEAYDESTGEATETQYLVEVPAMVVDRPLLGHTGVYLGPEAAERLGTIQSAWGRTYLLETSTVVDGGVVEGVNADLGGGVADGGVGADIAVTDYDDPTTFYIMLAVAALCAVIALGSTAVSTGLIIAEQRRDMTTLGAVGAAPGLRKRFAMWQTVVIALFGTVLGTIAGVIGYVLIREALNRPLRDQYPYQILYGWELPWMSFGIMLLAVPVIAAVGALAFTKARLPSERRLT